MFWDASGIGCSRAERRLPVTRKRCCTTTFTRRRLVWRLSRRCGRQKTSNKYCSIVWPKNPSSAPTTHTQFVVDYAPVGRQPIGTKDVPRAGGWSTFPHANRNRRASKPECHARRCSGVEPFSRLQTLSTVGAPRSQHQDAQPGFRHDAHADVLVPCAWSPGAAPRAFPPTSTRRVRDWRPRSRARGPRHLRPTPR